MAAVAAAPPEAFSAERQLAQLQDLLERQTAARQALHEAVALADAAGVRAALCAEASELLLPVELRWAERVLAVLEVEEAEQQALAAARAALADACSCARSPEELEGAIVAARSAGVPAADVAAAEVALAGARAAQLQRCAEEEAWAAVERAVKACDVADLIATLKRAGEEASLPPERIAEAERKIPGMHARAQMRRELLAAMRSSSGGAEQLRHAVAMAKRIGLPEADFEQAEQQLRDSDLERKRQAAAKTALAEQFAAMEAASTVGTPVSQDASSLASEREAEQPEPAKARAASTPLEEAVLSGERSRVQKAVEALRSSGVPAREVQRLHVLAMSEFGRARGP